MTPRVVIEHHRVATRTTQLRRLFRVVNGGTPTADPLNWDGPIPWATPVDLARVNGGVLSETERTLSRTGLDAASTQVPAGSLVVSTRAPIGYVAEAREPMAFNQGCKGLAPATSVDIRYYRYVLSSMTGGLNARGQGSTFVELSTDALASTPVPAPGLAEQRAIADFLDVETARIDALIAKKRRLITLLEERWLVHARALLIGAEWVGNPFDVRETFRDGRDVYPYKLARIAKFGSGTTPASDVAAYYDGDIPWVVTGDLPDGEIRDTSRTITERALREYSALKVHPAGTIVIAMYGATIGKLGVLTEPAAVNQACCTLQPDVGYGVDPTFLFMYLLAFRAELIDLGRGSGQPNISQEILRMAYVALPSFGFQRRVGVALSEMRAARDAAREKLEAQISLLQEKRQALITAAVTGELDIGIGAA